MPGENLRKTGKEMEDLAAEYLSSRAVRILERNFRSREAEIDIIGQQEETLLFVWSLDAEYCRSSILDA